MSRDIFRIADEHVALWEKRAELTAFRAKVDQGKELTPRRKVVAIGNMMGANGRAIGKRVGKFLDIPNYDRDLLRTIAETAHISVRTIETLDEHARSRVDDYLAGLMNEKSFDMDDYLRLLTRVVVALWRHGPCVMTGHGCVHIIPRDCSLTVRLVAPLDLRVQRVASCGSLSLAEAKKRVLAADLERETFHHRHFKVNLRDCLLYDLVLNTAFLDDDACGRIIAAAYRNKFPSAQEGIVPAKFV
jgi:cytidylate kinase